MSLLSLPARWPLPRVDGATLAADARAGLVSAAIMLPQAVALAALAGLPPEVGIYAAAFPVAVAALAGHSGRLLSGPNTAVSAMVGAALAPVAAPYSADYLQFALILSALVGGLQIVLACSGAGRLLARLPAFMAAGVTLGVGVALMICESSRLCGLLDARDGPVYQSLWQLVAAVGHLNPYSLAVGAASLLAGWAAQRLADRRLPPLLVALLAGSAFASLLDLLFGAANTGIERMGQMQVHLLPFAWPRQGWDDWPAMQALLHSALPIAVVGALQTIVIARSLSGAAEVQAHARQELLAQGLANLSASVFGGVAGSASFNRTAAHVQAGARTALSGLLSGVLLLLLAWHAGGLLSAIAMPAMAATLILTGWGLVRSACVALSRRDRWAAVGLATLMTLLGFGPAVWIGLAAAVGRLAWRNGQAHATV